MFAESVLTKKQCYRFWQEGAFGNKLSAWPLEEWSEDVFGGKVVLRTVLGSGGGGPCVYDLDPCDVREVVSSLVEQGISRADVVVCEMADHRRAVLQGEYFNGVLLDGS